MKIKDTNSITITLTEREQLLLLANEYNDHPSWPIIARKIRKAQNKAKQS